MPVCQRHPLERSTPQPVILGLRCVPLPVIPGTQKVLGHLGGVNQVIHGGELLGWR